MKTQILATAALSLLSSMALAQSTPTPHQPESTCVIEVTGAQIPKHYGELTTFLFPALVRDFQDERLEVEISVSGNLVLISGPDKVQSANQFVAVTRGARKVMGCP